MAEKESIMSLKRGGNMNKRLTHLQRQYIKWCKYMRKVKDENKKKQIWKSLLILNGYVGRQR